MRDSNFLKENNARVACRDEIIPVLRDRFAQMSKAELVAKLGEAGLPFAPINRPEDLLEDPQVMSQGMHELRLPDQDRSVLLPKLPIEVDGNRSAEASDPPVAGEHTDAVLAGLGFDEDKVRELRARGVVG